MTTSTAANDPAWIRDVTLIRPDQRAGVTIEIGAGCFLRLPDVPPDHERRARAERRAWRARVRAGVA